MSIFDSFKTERILPLSTPDLSPVADDLMAYFRGKEFDVTSLQTSDGAWQISVARGGFFESLVGLKTALNMRIKPQPGGTFVSASAGLFELQALPTAIALLWITPVIFAQIWGLIQQEKLDDEAVNVVENSLRRHAATTPTSASFDGVAENI